MISDDPGRIGRERAETAQVVGAVVVSGAAQFGAKIVLFVLNIVAALAIVRYLGPATYGDYIFVLSFTAIFGLLSELGVNKVAARDMTRDEAAAPAIIGTAIVGQVMLAAFGWAAAQAVFTLLPDQSHLRTAVAIASLLYFTDSFALAFSTIFQVRLALQYDAVARVVAQALDTALILWLIEVNADLLWLIAAPVITGAVGVLVAAAVVRWRFRTPVRFERQRLAPLISEAIPVGLTSIVVIAYLRLDSVLLGILGTSEDVGYYGAASRPVEYLILALAVLVNVLFPLLARWYGVDPRRFAALFAHGASALLAVSLPIAVLVLVFAGEVVALLYPPEFAESALILRVLVGSVVLTVLGAWAGFALLSARQQRIVLVCNSVALALNVALNLALIPGYAYMGAAYAALATSAFVALSTTAFAVRRLSVAIDGQRAMRLLFANGCAGVVAWTGLSLQLPWPVAATIGMGSYLVLVWLFRAVSTDELRLLAARAP